MKLGIEKQKFEDYCKIGPECCVCINRDMRLEQAQPDDGDDLLLTRHSLLSRLKDWNDQDSWNDFFEIYWKLIYRAAIKCGLTDAEAQDVVQETVLSACKSLPNFHYDPAKGSFRKWLLQLTRWRINGQLRKRQCNIHRLDDPADASTTTESLEDLVDPAAEQVLDTLWDEEWEKGLLHAALERVKQKIDAKHYQIFDLHVVKEWPVARVTRALRVNRTAVYIVKHRVTRLMKQEVDRLRNHPI